MDPAMRTQQVAVDAAAAPSNPPPPPPENRRMQVAVLNVMDLPLKKRILMILRTAEAQNEESRFTCSICQRAFGTARALAGHRAHHREGPSEKKRPRGGGALVVYGGPHQCARCERVFGSGRGLGAHTRFCKGRPSFDLNKPPPPAAEEGLFSLPWYSNRSS